MINKKMATQKLLKNIFTLFVVFIVLKEGIAMGLFSSGLKREFKTAMVNEPSVFEPLKFYCIHFQGSFLDFLEHEGSQEYRCPSSSRDGGTLKIYGSKCYQFIQYELHWHHARQFCLNRGADLITIHRSDIQAFVERSLREIGWSKNGMWIGATDEQDERNWRWVTGQRVNSGYDNWDSGQPSCWLPIESWCKEDCACLRLDEGYKWHDYFCAAPKFEYGFVCQYDMLPIAQAPVTQKMAGNKTTQPRDTTVTSKKTTTARAKTTSASKPVVVTEADIKAADVDGDYSKSGKGCSYGDKIYKAGDHFPDIDGCNTCHCSNGFVGCTEMYCIREGKDCFYDGGIHKTGDRFRVGDDCNWCYCNNGQVNCTGLCSAVNQIGVQSQQVSSKDKGLKTGSIVGILVSFVLVFVAGLVLGILLCKRRYKKRYEETASAGFSNVLYTAAPQQTQVKQSVLYASDQDSDLDLDHDDQPPHYTSIDNIHVPPSYCEATATGSNIYADVADVKKVKPDGAVTADADDAGVDNHEELTVNIPPPPCRRRDAEEVHIDNLQQITDGVSEAYSNNLYGVQ